MLDLYRTYTYYLVKSIRVREGERMTPLLYEVEDGLAIVTLNRPDQMNATSPAMRELLIEATYRAETDDAVRAVLIRGAGEHFMAGGDRNGGGLGKGVFGWCGFGRRRMLKKTRIIEEYTK